MISTTHSGPDLHDALAVDRDSAERVRADLKMPVGELGMQGGSPKLMTGDFTYNVPDWKPELRYNLEGTTGNLLLEQHGPHSSSGNAKNRWDVRLNDGVPLDLRVELGAGEGKLNLGSLTLENLTVEVGAGTLRLDLRGAPRKDYSAHIRGGVGDATIYLPTRVGVAATATGGIGDIKVQGLHKSGDRYVNDVYDTAPVRIHLDVQGGIGSISLIAE